MKIDITNSVSANIPDGPSDDLHQCENCFRWSKDEICYTCFPDIKQCPFCASSNLGIDAQTIYGPGSHNEFWIYCKNCGARGPNDINVLRAVQMWNLRRDKK